MFFKFQWTFLFYSFRFVNYSHKIVTDFQSVLDHYNNQDYYKLMITAFSLVSPMVFCALYNVGEIILKGRGFGLKDILYVFVDGLLLIPWQLKRFLDVIFYSFKRIYVCRSPSSSEKADLAYTERQAEFREFFEDVYAGFPVLCLELYVLTPKIEKLEFQLLFNRQIIGSFFSIISMMIAVRRRDDGPLFRTLSFIGWLLIFISRTIIFSTTAFVFGVWLLIPLTVHVLSFTVYVYCIAVNSYRQKRKHLHNCRRIVLLLMVLIFFGIPSLMLWPFMFQLNEKRRPLKFLAILLVENVILIGSCIYACYQFHSYINCNNLLLAMLFASCVGSVFLWLYTFKPQLTDQVTRHDDQVARQNHQISQVSECSGVYYVFCDLVFILPEPNEIAADLSLVRQAYS